MRNLCVEEVSHDRYGDCVRVSNGMVEVLVTVEVGPRIIRYGFVGKGNVFCENADVIVNVDDDNWKMRGGHRLWHSPESKPRSYIPDNDLVDWHKTERGISVEQKVEPWAQIKKEMEILVSADSSEVEVTHRLINMNAWPVELAAWGISVMAEGGKHIIPQPRGETNLLPNRVLALWPYSKMNDCRVYWGDKFITLQQNPDVEEPFKFGISNEAGWAAYFNEGQLFLKRYIHEEDATYPDYGVSYEAYVTDFMMEMETLSPLTTLLPEASLSHVEKWELVDDIETPADNEEKIENLLGQYVEGYQ